MYSVRDLSSRVNALSAKTAENLLEIGSAFIDAKTHLQPTEHTEFLKETNYVTDSSTVRKWEVIGKSYLKLKAVVHLLPPVFTTIYKLSSLTADELDVLIKNNILHPAVTTKEINAELNPQSQSKTLPKFTVLFNQFATEEVVNEVNSFLTNYSSYLAVNANDQAQELLN